MGLAAFAGGAAHPEYLTRSITGFLHARHYKVFAYFG